MLSENILLLIIIVSTSVKAAAQIFYYRREDLIWPVDKFATQFVSNVSTTMK